MSRKFLLLLAGCALTLPGIGFAKSADALAFAPPFAPVANANARITRSDRPVMPQPIVWARADAQPARPVVVIVPSSFEPVTLPMQGVLFRHIAAMNADIQVMLHLAAQPIVMPLPPASAASASVIAVSMTSVSASGGMCREMMTVTPASNGRVVIHIERRGGGCAVTPTTMAPSRSGPAQPGQGPGVDEGGEHFLPGNALPPPSKLTYAGYEAARSGPHATRE